MNTDMTDSKDIGVLFFVSRAMLSGSQQTTLDLLRHLPRFGIRTAICTPGDGELRRVCEDEGILHLWLDPGALSRWGHMRVTLGAYKKVKSFMNDNGLDVFVAYDLQSAYSIALKLLPDISFLFVTRDLCGINRSGGSIRKYVLKKVANRADAWACNSNFIYESLNPVIGSSSHSIVHNGVNLEPFLKINRDSDHKNRRLRIGLAGDLIPIKRQDQLIRAARELKEQGIEADIYLPGIEPVPGARYLALVKELVEELELAEQVHWLGYVEDMTSFYSNIDILVSACTVEAFGRVVVEAMASGVPVVAARAGGPIELLEDGKEGLFFEPDNHEDMARAIKELIADPSRMDEMGGRGRETAKNFTVEHMTRKMAEIINNITE